jgi:NTE family protein
MTIKPVRRGLVLGAGGALGAAWIVGALNALAEADGADPRSADVVLGTSAGSVIGALLGCGVSVEELAERLDIDTPPQVQGTGPVNAFDVHSALAAIPRPTLLPGNLRLAARTVSRAHRHTVMTLAAGLAPRGRGTLAPLADMIADAAGDAGWPKSPRTWIAAMDYDTGHRVVFGRPGAPAAALSEAVVASSAAPGFFPPATIGGRRYVDGGAVSMTNADVLADEGMDEVIVLAPMASFERIRRGSPTARADRRLRSMFTRRLGVEIDRLEASGTRVRVLAPTAEDLHVMGVNLMNPARRRDVLHMSLRTTREQLASLAVEAQ